MGGKIENFGKWAYTTQFYINLANLPDSQRDALASGFLMLRQVVAATRLGEMIRAPPAKMPG